MLLDMSDQEIIEHRIDAYLVQITELHAQIQVAEQELTACFAKQKIRQTYNQFASCNRNI